MFDQEIYNTVFTALSDILRRNLGRLGQEFAEGFMFDHDIRRGQQSQQNAQVLLDYISNQAQRLNNGQNYITGDQQLFTILGPYVENYFTQYMRQRQNGGNTMNFSRGGPSLNFGGGGSMGGNQGGGNMFSQNRGSSGFNQQQPNLSPGSHLADDTIDSRGTMSPPQAAPAPVTSMFAQPAVVPQQASSVKYVPNPLDGFPESGVEYNPVKNKATWGDEKPKDRRIILAARDDMKTRDSKFSINRSVAFHQVILDDPMDVVKDFFKIVPDSTLASPFLFKIIYNHLEIIDVSTDDFLTVQRKCQEAIEKDRNTVLHKKVAEALDEMPRGPWKAMTTYLCRHVNRALYLAARLSNDTEAYVQIGSFEDLDELLSSSYRSDFTAHPEGRIQLEKIVGSAIWNALMMNSSVMFDKDTSIPTNAIQTSPAFPYSLDGVYPSKFSIPVQSDALADIFMDKMRENELSKRSYILSRRSVVITNILGKGVLSKIDKEPKVINSPLAPMLDAVIIPYGRIDIDMAYDPVLPNISEEHFSDQLEAYYTDPTKNEFHEIDAYGRKRPALFPVDQTIFAVQYGVNPSEYLMALDVFSTIDRQLGQAQMVLAKKQVPTLKTTA